MTPKQVSCHSTYRAYRDAIFLGECRQMLACLSAGADERNVRLGQLRFVMCGAKNTADWRFPVWVKRLWGSVSSGFLAASCSALGGCVQSVFVRRPKEQVIGIAARRVVASVQHVCVVFSRVSANFWQCDSVCQLICDAMTPYGSFSPHNPTVALAINGAGPKPTSAFFAWCKSCPEFFWSFCPRPHDAIQWTRDLCIDTLKSATARFLLTGLGVEAALQGSLHPVFSTEFRFHVNLFSVFA